MYLGGRNPGDTFGQFFTGGGTLAPFSAWRILAYPTQVDNALSAFNITQIQLARHLIASYLNFYKVGATFPLSLAQLQAMWTQGIGAGYCPTGTGCTQLWSATTIICYLQNYTMDPTQGAFDFGSCTGVI